MLSIRCFYLTFLRFFCRIKVYKGKWRRFYPLLCGVALLCGGCRPAEVPAPTPSPTADDALRGVWLSYIELDALLASGNPQQAAHGIAQVMATCADKGLNAVFFHVRAHGDAYFPSQVWPTASGMMAGFDPLALAVQEAHARGIALHAWVNPYRLGDTAVEGMSFSKNGGWYLDPANPAAQQTLLDGVREILDNYDVDGIHFDDYFYPAGMSAAGEPFEVIPDDTNVAAWRRTQVDALISGVYGLCHQRGKLFGVSPAADVARNRVVAYADVARWMTEAGYIDYICPQLYVGFRHQTKPFLSLLEEWRRLPRRDSVKLYVGLAQYKVGLERDPYAGTGADEWATDEDIIPRQIEAVRDVTDGYVLFRYENIV